jgi:hypothetical protein
LIHHQTNYSFIFKQNQKFGNGETDRGGLSALAEQLAIVDVPDNVEPESSQDTQTPEPPPLAMLLKDVDKPTPQNLLEVFHN